jgi:hypothetical protein
VLPIRLIIVAAGLMLIVACVSGDASGIPSDSVLVVANTDIGIERERLLIRVAALDGARLGSPQDQIRFEVAPVDFPDEAQLVDGAFFWVVPEASGFYRAEFEFDRPGLWQLIATPEGGESLEPALFSVLEETSAPALGQLAPVAPTLTADDLPFAELTSDPDPDPRLYEITLEEALANGESTVLLFATPAFCTSATCGPIVETVKELLPNHDANFIHVEVYQGLNDPEFDADVEHLAPAVTSEYWNLPSEPWVFVIDEEGFVVARFEGAVEAEEIAQHLR